MCDIPCKRGQPAQAVLSLARQVSPVTSVADPVSLATSLCLWHMPFSQKSDTTVLQQVKELRIEHWVNQLHNCRGECIQMPTIACSKLKLNFPADEWGEEHVRQWCSSCILRAEQGNTRRVLLAMAPNEEKRPLRMDSKTLSPG